MAGSAEAAEAARALAEERGRRDIEGAALLRAAGARAANGQAGQALLAYQQALPLLREAGDHSTAADVLLAQGDALLEMGREEEAAGSTGSHWRLPTGSTIAGGRQPRCAGLARWPRRLPTREPPPPDSGRCWPPPGRSTTVR